MAIFEGNVQEFHQYFGPRIRNAINLFARKERIARNGTCEHCGQRNKELDSAHVHGRNRRSIIEEVLSNHEINGIVRCDVAVVERQILDGHGVVSETFKFLCKDCHIEYDRQTATRTELPAGPAPVRSTVDTVGLETKRQKIVQGFMRREGRLLFKKSAALYWDTEGRIRAAVSVSKRHPPPSPPYWYGYQHKWKDFLDDSERGHIVFGCFDRGHAFAIPVKVFHSLLVYFDENTKGGFFHIRLKEASSGELRIILSKRRTEFTINEYMFNF